MTDAEEQTSRPQRRAAATNPSTEMSLFSVVMFHDSALEPTLRDWVSVLANDRDEALMHLLNLVLASAGCPGKLTKDQVSDLEDVSETLGQLQNQVNVVRCLYFHIDEAFKYFGQLKKFVREIQDVQHGYPLLPKKRGRAHLKFQKTMGEFWARLMARTQAQHLLLADRAWLLDALYQWLGAMSSSAFRPFRHTATFVSLCIQTALCDVARSLNASWMTLSRQSEASARKKTASSSEKLEELRASKELLDDMMTVLFDGIFIHRSRDYDPTIRAECVSALCQWIQKLPEKYLDPQYLRYVGWMLADKASSVRLETIKSLNALMTPAHLAGLRLFSDRFKGRVLDMAVSDNDDAARLSAIDALVKLGTLDLLDEEDAAFIIPLLFDPNVKIRQSTAPLIPGLLKDKQPTDSDDARSQLKLFCQLLLDNMDSLESESDEEAFKSSHSDDLGFEEEEVFRMRVRDRNDLVDWLTKSTEKSCPLPSFGSVRAKHVVEALWTELPLVQDWELMGDYLADSLSEDDDDALTPEQETCLVYLFSASATVFTEKSHRDEDSMPSLTRGLIKLLPILMRKYKNNFTEDMAKLSEIVRLVRIMDFEMYIKLRMHTALDALLTDLADVFAKHNDMQVLQDCAATFHFLIGNDEDETQDSVKTDTDTGGLSEQVKATALKRVKELLGQIVSSQIVPAYDELRYESTESKSDACLHLHHALQRLSFLTSHTDLHAMDAALSDVDSPFSTWYELANGVVDVGLLTLTAAKNEDFEALSKDTSRMIASALEFMFFLSFWGLSAAYVTRKMDGSEHSQETVTLDQTNRLIDICEAIVTGEDSDEIAFHLGLKLFAIKKLTALYIMMNSDVSTFTKSPRTPPEMVQAKISLVIERALIAVCLLDVQAESFDDFKEDAKMCPLFVQSAASMRKEILTIASQLGQLLIAGILVPSKGVLMLKYYGLSDTPAQKNVTSSIQVTPTTCAFGEKWNIISSAAAKETLTSNLVKRLELLDFKDRNFPDRLEELLESTSGFVFQSIGQALELYFSGLVPSLDPVLDLTKMLMPFIKTWPTLLKSNKSVLCSALKNVLVTLLADACQNLVDRMVTFDRSEAKTNRRYSVISDLSMYSENGTAPVTCKLATWSEVNAVWKIWGAMGGLIHHILGALEDENAPDQSLFEDLKNGLLNRLTDLGIKPVQGHKDWEGFWHFMKAIDKGDSSLKKGQSKGKAPARTKRKEFPDASPKAVTKKPKKVQPKKKVPISDADAIGLPLRRSDRRSSMTTYSESTSEEDEGDMQDEEDVEDEDDRENVDPSPSPEKTPVPQHRRGPASKSKIEFLADDTASLDVRDDNYEDNDEDILGLSSIPKRKTQVDMELDFLSSPPSLLSKKIRRM